MTYVLLFNRGGHGLPDVFQGSIEEINKQLMEAWLNEDIDQEEWDFSQNWQLLAIEYGQLTTVGRCEMRSIPQVSVD
jgi:hypothetical protein